MMTFIYHARILHDTLEEKKRVRLVWREYFHDLQPYQFSRGFRILAFPSGKYIMTFIYHACILYHT